MTYPFLKKKLDSLCCVDKVHNNNIKIMYIMFRIGKNSIILSKYWKNKLINSAPYIILHFGALILFSPIINRITKCLYQRLIDKKVYKMYLF